MEKLYIKSRIDCPPLETRLVLKEKDFIIQKQQDEIRALETNLELVKKQRDYLIGLFQVANIEIDLVNLKKRSNGIDTAALTDKTSSILNQTASTITKTEELILSEIPNAKSPSNTNTNTSNNEIANENNLNDVKYQQHKFISNITSSNFTPKINATKETLQNCFEIENKNDLDQLKRKYGGHVRINRAASTIQQAYRQYRLRKNYFKIYENSAKRRSLDIDRIAKIKGTKYSSLTPEISGMSLLSQGASVNGSTSTKTRAPVNTRLKFGENDKDLIDSVKKISDLVAESCAETGHSEISMNFISTPSNSCSSVHSLVSNSTASTSSSSCSSSTASTSTSTTSTSSSCALSTATNATGVATESEPKLAEQQTTGAMELIASSATMSPPLSVSSTSSLLQNANKMYQGAENTSVSSSDIHSKAYERKMLVGLNLFNRKPERGVQYLVESNCIDYSPHSVAEFLFRSKYISKQILGEYLSNNRDTFVKEVMNEFCKLINFKGLPVDEALREFQSHFRLPGEAQKIEYLTQVFSSHYIQTNEDECKRVFKCAEETIDVLAYAIILLNTTIHNPKVKQSDKMKFEHFCKMTRGIDDGSDIDRNYLLKAYERVKTNEFKADKDHVTIVMDFEKNLVGIKKQISLAAPYRRLICYVQLCEVYDLTKKEKTNQHQRDVFLFNDMLVIAKVFSKKKSNTLYTFRNSFPLHEMEVYDFRTDYYQNGIRLMRITDKKVLVTFNARNRNDQRLFCSDLSDAILEANEIEALRIKAELEKKKLNTSLKFIDTDVLNADLNKSVSKANETVLNATISNSNFGNSRKQESKSLRVLDKSLVPSKRTLSNSLLDLSNDKSTIYANPSNTILTHRTGSENSLNEISKDVHHKFQDDCMLELKIKYDKTDKVEARTSKSTKLKQSRVSMINTKSNEDTLDDRDKRESNPKTPKSADYLDEEKINALINKTNMNGHSKYFTLSTSTAKSIDKSLRNMFKYVGLNANSSQNSQK